MQAKSQEEPNRKAYTCKPVLVAGQQPDLLRPTRWVAIASCGIWPALPLTGYWLLYRPALALGPPLPVVTAFALCAAAGVAAWSPAMLAAAIAGIFRPAVIGIAGWITTAVSMVCLGWHGGMAGPLTMTLGPWDALLLAVLLIAAWLYLGFPDRMHPLRERYRCLRQPRRLHRPSRPARYPCAMGQGAGREAQPCFSIASAYGWEFLRSPSVPRVLQDRENAYRAVRSSVSDLVSAGVLQLRPGRPVPPQRRVRTAHARRVLWCVYLAGPSSCRGGGDLVPGLEPGTDLDGALTLSEILTQLLLWSGTLLLIRALAYEQTSLACWAGGMFGLAALVAL